MLRCVAMGANARQCSRMQYEIIASKRELPVKTLNIRILKYYTIVVTLSYVLHYRCALCNLYFYIREERDSLFTCSVKYFDYFRVTLSCNSVYHERGVVLGYF